MGAPRPWSPKNTGRMGGTLRDPLLMRAEEPSCLRLLTIHPRDRGRGRGLAFRLDHSFIADAFDWPTLDRTKDKEIAPAGGGLYGRPTREKSGRPAIVKTRARILRRKYASAFFGNRAKRSGPNIY